MTTIILKLVAFRKFLYHTNRIVGHGIMYRTLEQIDDIIKELATKEINGNKSCYSSCRSEICSDCVDGSKYELEKI